jgi:hypothetical protein
MVYTGDNDNKIVEMSDKIKIKNDFLLNLKSSNLVNLLTVVNL